MQMYCLGWMPWQKLTRTATVIECIQLAKSQAEQFSRVLYTGNVVHKKNLPDTRQIVFISQYFIHTHAFHYHNDTRYDLVMEWR